MKEFLITTALLGGEHLFRPAAIVLLTLASICYLTLSLLIAIPLVSICFVIGLLVRAFTFNKD